MSTLCKRGTFIVFEGIDRCGKTTQCNLLVDHLKSMDKSTSAEFIRFPNRSSTIGQLINSYLSSSSDINDHTIHLLFSANRWEERDSIVKKLASGSHLICDRYAYSGVAFTSAKGLDFNWCKSCDIGLPSPDLVIYLDIPVEEAATRGNYGDERYEKIDFQKIVREKFMTLKTQDEEYNVPWIVLDARKPIDDLSAEIREIVSRVINETQHQEIKALWK